MNEQSVPTGIYGDNPGQPSEGTALYSQGNGPGAKSKLHQLGEGDRIRLKEKEYTITGIISEDTGEAVIYKVMDGDLEFALKLYRYFENAAEEPNSETLERIRKLTGEGILKLIDYGTGPDKYEEKHCFEISEFARGGDLLSVPPEKFKKKFSPEFLKGTLMPQVLEGIRSLHQEKIFHCDLKPTNIFFRDAGQSKIAIGDYGSAKSYDIDSELPGRQTTTVKGTKVYMDPEQATGLVSEKNDYYSLGMTLFHLLYPEQLCEDNNYRLVDNKKFKSIAERRYKTGNIVPIEDKDNRFNDLLAGLTFRDPIQRWGHAEVRKWMKGDPVKVPNQRVVINCGDRIIEEIEDLVSYIETTPRWYEVLVENQHGRNQFQNWVSATLGIPVMMVLEGMINYYSQDGPAYTSEAISRYFNPSKPLNIDGISIDFQNRKPDRKPVNDFFKQLDIIWKKQADIKTLRFLLFQAEFCLRQAVMFRREGFEVYQNALNRLEMLTPGKSGVSFEDYKCSIYQKLSDQSKSQTIASNQLLVDLFYGFDERRGFMTHDAKRLDNIEKVGQYFAGNEGQYNDVRQQAELKKFLALHKVAGPGEMKYHDFLFYILREKQQSTITLTKVDFNGKNSCHIEFIVGRSLNKYLKEHKIQNNVLAEAPPMGYDHKIRILPLTGSIFRGMIRDVCGRFGLTLKNFNTKDLSKAKSKIRVKVLGYDLRCAGRGILLTVGAVLFALPLVTAIITAKNILMKELVADPHTMNLIHDNLSGIKQYYGFFAFFGKLSGWIQYALITAISLIVAALPAVVFRWITGVRSGLYNYQVGVRSFEDELFDSWETAKFLINKTVPVILLFAVFVLGFGGIISYVVLGILNEWVVQFKLTTWQLIQVAYYASVAGYLTYISFKMCYAFMGNLKMNKSLENLIWLAFLVPIVIYLGINGYSDFQGLINKIIYAF